MLFGGAAMPVFPAFAANVRHMFVVITDRFAAFATDFRHMPAILADGFTALASDFRHVFPVLADGFPAFATDFRHMSAILADRFTTFMACLPRFFGVKLVRRAFFMSGMTALAGYLPLLVLVHGGKTAIAGSVSAALIIPVTAMRTAASMRVAFM
jgi:hypothetical protein